MRSIALVERLRRLAGHPVVLIVVWVPTIVLLPGDWITVGNAISDSPNLARLLLGVAGLVAILLVTGHLPLPRPQGTSPEDDQGDEVALGRRAILVSRRVRQAYAEAMGRFERCHEEMGNENVAECHRNAMSWLHWRIGGSWVELLGEMERRGLIADAMRYSATVNMVGLGEHTQEIEAIGRGLMRSHGVDPDTA